MVESKKESYLINGKILTPHRVIALGGVHVRGEYIAEVFTMAEANIPVEAQTIDVQGAWVIPGIVDMHLDGGGGGDMMDGKVESLRTMACVHAQGGTTTITPTTETSSTKELIRALDTFEKAQELVRSSLTGSC